MKRELKPKRIAVKRVGIKHKPDPKCHRCGGKGYKVTSFRGSSVPNICNCSDYESK